MSLEHSPARALLIRRRALLQLLGVSHTTLYSWISAGKFPAPINIGANSVAWLTSEIDGFIERRRAERDQQLDPAE